MDWKGLLNFHGMVLIVLLQLAIVLQKQIYGLQDLI